MSERINFITHNDKKILVIDLSHCSAIEAEQTIRRVPDIVTEQPRGSVLILTDYTGSSVDKEVLHVIKESAVFDKPYVKKSAWIGAEDLPEVFRENLKHFSGRDFPMFKTRKEALDWLTE